MQTYNEIVDARKDPVRSAELFYEYVSAYRRVVMVWDGSTWELRVTYYGFAKELKGWFKTGAAGACDAGGIR